MDRPLVSIVTIFLNEERYLAEAVASVLGQTFDGPMPGHNPQMPWHYDLHAWVVESNPAGTFSMFNPSISC